MNTPAYHWPCTGLRLVTAFGAGQANAEELTGTLKKIKGTGAITIGFRDSSIPFPIWTTTRSRSVCDRHLLPHRRRVKKELSRQARGPFIR